jgi:hypothetical protein
LKKNYYDNIIIGDLKMEEKTQEEQDNEIDGLKSQLLLLQKKLEEGTELSTSRNETDLDSIEIGNSKVGHFKVYFNLKETSDEELKKLLDRAISQTKHANSEQGVKE